MKVKDGFARNYPPAAAKALRATEANRRRSSAARAIEARNPKRREAAEARPKLDGGLSS